MSVSPSLSPLSSFSPMVLSQLTLLLLWVSQTSRSIPTALSQLLDEPLATLSSLPSILRELPSFRPTTPQLYPPQQLYQSQQQQQDPPKKQFPIGFKRHRHKATFWICLALLLVGTVIALALACLRAVSLSHT